ncbi:3-deoxy-manno-octulosonate cytidylyltransferase [Sphingomonas ginkgonis]|uniref:3-deoxy-manno-octulosonate cytidylyltransferase n=1 Tax=Sphingomonas ginkgonis TaxID=2315330 RepID=A0A3R9WPN0_9SPHN|nr:manno-octulosonate cytidylyltransferase [Sphingomonas ginkgonis]RST30375.1 3-deoxy-manno-octulosonate cytidylyltransferase [Sphingomonas ginkgonis]
MAVADAPSVAIVIPARFASTRFPGKPLTRFRGADGTARTLIEHSWRAASAFTGASTIVVATDDERIAREVESFGGSVVMTPADCRNGTERCAAALPAIPGDADIIVNLQGDAPLTPPDILSAVVARLGADPYLPVATPAIRCTPTVYRHLADDAAAGRVGGTTVVFNRHHDALYFSKRILPYVDPEQAREQTPDVYLHLGIYAYRRAALTAYVDAGPCQLEQQEGLEQLRFLDAGLRVGVALCEPPAWDVIEVNNPGDAPLVEAILRRRDAR